MTGSDESEQDHVASSLPFPHASYSTGPCQLSLYVRLIAAMLYGMRLSCNCLTYICFMKVFCLMEVRSCVFMLRR
jgi:hypothetical protein